MPFEIQQYHSGCLVPNTTLVRWWRRFRPFAGSRETLLIGGMMGRRIAVSAVRSMGPFREGLRGR
jgi:hypothetical protein